MSKQISIILVLFTALAGVVAGCGGGSSDPALTKAEFIKKADKICEKADETQGGEAIAYQRAHKDATTEKMVSVILLPSVLKQVEDIEALGVPSEDEQTISEFTDGVRAAVKEAEKDPGSVTNDGGPFVEVNKLAGEYGFKNCENVT